MAVNLLIRPNWSRLTANEDKQTAEITSVYTNRVFLTSRYRERVQDPIFLRSFDLNLNRNL